MLMIDGGGRRLKPFQPAPVAGRIDYPVTLTPGRSSIRGNHAFGVALRSLSTVQYRIGATAWMWVRGERPGTPIAVEKRWEQQHGREGRSEYHSITGR
jgi:hypothetical protein